MNPLEATPWDQVQAIVEKYEIFKNNKIAKAHLLSILYRMPSTEILMDHLSCNGKFRQFISIKPEEEIWQPEKYRDELASIWISNGYLSAFYNLLKELSCDEYALSVIKKTTVFNLIDQVPKSKSPSDYPFHPVFALDALTYHHHVKAIRIHSPQEQDLQGGHDDNPTPIPNNFSRLSKFCAAMIEHESGLHSCLLAPIFPQEGDDVWKRLGVLGKLLDFFVSVQNLYKTLPKESVQELTYGPIRVCALSGMFDENKNRVRYMREAEMVRSNLEKVWPGEKSSANPVYFIERKFSDNSRENANLAYRLDEALVLSDILVPMDGTIGNLLVRSLCLSSGSPWRLRALPWFVLNPLMGAGDCSTSLPMGEDNQFFDQPSESSNQNVQLWQALRILETQHLKAGGHGDV